MIPHNNKTYTTYFKRLIYHNPKNLTIARFLLEITAF